MFRNVLVCVDSSPEAGQALHRAIDLADCERCRLTILTAICRPPCWTNTSLTAAGIQPLTVELADEAKRTLDRAVERVPNCIPVTRILSEDPIRVALARLLREDRHDLVVLGTRGRRPISAGLHRSLSRYALRHSEIPVLAVGANGVGDPEPRRAQEPAATAVA